MTQRCCASGCFNSSISSKGTNVKFFGFPKHEQFAKEWAIAAGREDLVTKPLKTVIKYYLCSDHFTPECLDASGRLIRSLPQFIAMPSIFKNNFDEVVRHNAGNISQEVRNIMIIQTESDCTHEQSDQVEQNELPSFLEDQVCQVLDELLSDSLNMEYFEDNDLPEDDVMAEEDAIIKAHCRLCGHCFTPNESYFEVFATPAILEFVRQFLFDSISSTDTGSKIACSKCASDAENCLSTIERFKQFQIHIINPE